MSGLSQLTPPALWWTPWPGTGPGQEVLGELTGRRVIELGCGRGDNAAACAAAGAHVVGVDIAPSKVQDARDRWSRQPRLRFERADAGDYLTRHTEPIDVVYSVFGALSYAPAGPLLDAITARLQPSGLLALSARLPPPRTDTTGASAGPWLAHAKTPTHWAAVLNLHGFRVTRSQVLAHPDQPDAAGCLILSATLAQRTSTPERRHRQVVQPLLAGRRGGLGAGRWPWSG